VQLRQQYGLGDDAAVLYMTKVHNAYRMCVLVIFSSKTIKYSHSSLVLNKCNAYRICIAVTSFVKNKISQ
jgi:hypothetical protein